MAGYKKKAPMSKKPTNNKQKIARRSFKAKTANYKSDHQSAVCCAFVDSQDAITQVVETKNICSGALANTGDILKDIDFTIKAVIALDADTTLLSSHRHTSLKNMFNEFNTSAIYLDLLFSPELRANCDQIFLLVERGIEDPIETEAQMVSDVNCRMYQLGNNTQKLTYKHIFNTAQDKINKKSSNRTITPSETSYLKILAKGRNNTEVTLKQGDLKIKLRAKCYNKYRDMKALSSGLN